MPNKLTFDEDGHVESTVENSNAIAEGLAHAIAHRHRVFLLGAVAYACIVGVLMGVVLQLFTRYTGGVALCLGIAFAGTYALGAFAGYGFANEVVRVKYEPVEKR